MTRRWILLTTVVAGLVAVYILAYAIGRSWNSTQEAAASTAATVVALGTLSLALHLLLVRHHAAQGKRLENSLRKLAEAESKHDYHRKLQLEQLETALNRVRAVVEGVSGQFRPIDSELHLPYDVDSELPRVLFVTSNGAGMGHLTRCLAVARSGFGLFQSHFVSLSSSAEVVRRLGYEVLKYPSYGQANGLSHTEWNNRFAEFFDGVCRANKPDAIVFDGTWIYRGIHETAKRHGIQLIWLRRGLWMNGASIIQVRDRRSLADHLLVPADLAEDADTGPVAELEGKHVPAPTLINSTEVLSRNNALLAMGLDTKKTYAMVQLGAGTINDIKGLRAEIIDQVLEHPAGVEVVVGLSPLSPPYDDNRDRVHVVRDYPIAHLLHAFEFLVIAGGYNSVHESVRFGVPAIVIPNVSTTTDNQQLRAAEYERLGYGLSATTDSEVRSAIIAMLDPQQRRKFTQRITNTDVVTDSGEGAATAIHDWLIR